MLDRDNVKGQEVKAVERIQKNISDKTMTVSYATSFTFSLK